MSTIPYIEGSVGKSGKNRPIDVAIIQKLLNVYNLRNPVMPKLPSPSVKPNIAKSIISATLSPTASASLAMGIGSAASAFFTENANRMLKVNGLIGQGPVYPLYNAIETFQKDVLKKKNPEGRIDPKAYTIGKLVGFLPDIKGERKNIIFGKPLVHTDVLSKVKKDRFQQLFQKQFDKTPQGLAKLTQFIINDTDIKDVRWAAYMLATAYHETAYTLQPIGEYGKGKNRPYGKEITVKDSKGKEHKNVYYGRGYVQLTWEANYKKMSKSLGLGEDLHIHPEKALNADTAYKIMSYGMRNGSFTGVGLKRYIDGEKCDYSDARKIINGLDRAKDIKGYAEKIELLLRLAAIA